MRCKIYPVRVTIVSLVMPFCFAGSLQTVKACVCDGPGVSDRDDAVAEFRDAAVVFEREVSASPKEVVAATSSHLGVRVIQFRVLRAYKGNLVDSIQLFGQLRCEGRAA